MSLYVVVKDTDGKELATVEFYTPEDETAGWPAIGPARHVSDDSSDEISIALAKKWLHGCLTSHTQCRRNGVPELPSRVIEVGIADQDVRLYVNKSGVKAEYAALSHCWGDAAPTLLLKAQLERMQNSLVLNESSKTFKDAITLTRRLGIRYIWIDSLCILQDKDDKSDWESEAPKMSSVYNNATITLSAASSTSTTGGLFPHHSARKQCDWTVELVAKHEGGQPRTVFARLRHRPFDVHRVVHSGSKLQDPKLKTRGWVLQEDQLSPRMLHFRPEELAWTCSTYTRCECKLKPDLPMPHPFRAAPGTRSIDKKLTTRILDLQWIPMVMEYTRRNLTVAEDRIYALSGLAKYMEGETTDTYYAGLWYEDMAYQLLWYVDRHDANESIRSRFKFPYAPSWSWISIPGPISYYERYPAGSAPSHPAIRSQDAVAPLLVVINVGRFPVSWENTFAKLFMCPMLIAGAVLPVHFNFMTKRWECDPAYPVADFESSILRVALDAEEDEPQNNMWASQTDSYVFILAGRWFAQGMTILRLQAVCILARRMPEAAEPLLDAARRFQLKYAAGAQADDGQAMEPEQMMLPTIENSYERIGFVRGAGSLEAWEHAKVPKRGIFLF